MSNDKYSFGNFSASLKLATTLAFLTLTGIGGTAIWKASSQVARIDAMEEKYQEEKATHDDTIKTLMEDHDRIGQMEGDMKAMKESLDNVEERQKEWSEDYKQDMRELKELIKLIPK